MKRILLALVIASASLLTLSSCTKEYITNNFVPSITMIYEREARDWVGSGNSLQVDLTVKELTSYYMDQGIVTVAMSTDGEKTFITIPATIDGIAYSYEYNLGKIRILMQDPIVEDGIVLNPAANTIFKVSLTDADWIE